MSSSKYVQEAVSNVQKYVNAKTNLALLKRATGPWPREYVAEVDESDELDAELANFYQSQVGVLHWIVELGRVDIITEVSTLALHMALP